MTWLENLQEKAHSIYSQGGQDGLIEEIFTHIPIVNNPPFAVEFGFNSNSYEGGSGANTCNLAKNKGWKTLLFDSQHANKNINLHRRILDMDNVNDVFSEFDVPRTPDYLSIDIDSADLWLMDTILAEYKPSLVSVEYNSHFPYDAAITMDPYTKKYIGGRIYGASLKALTMVAEQHNYCLVAIACSLDAFYIRKELLNDVPLPYISWKPYTGIIGHPICHNIQLGNCLIDYEEWLRSHDLEKARETAKPIVAQSLLSHPFTKAPHPLHLRHCQNCKYRKSYCGDVPHNLRAR